MNNRSFDSRSRYGLENAKQLSRLTDTVAELAALPSLAGVEIAK